MRAFEELTHEEILALGDEDIQRYCDLACAQEGAPLLPPEPGEKPEKPTYKPDVEIYSAGGDYFRERESAQAVADAINEGSRIEWNYAGGGYSQMRITGTKHEIETVNTSQFFSGKLWAEIEGEMIAYEEAKKQWGEEKKEYDEAVKARSRVTEWIWEKIAEVREAERQRERFAALLTRYLDLADGDDAVARKFLLDAHPEAEEFLGGAAEPKEGEG